MSSTRVRTKETTPQAAVRAAEIGREYGPFAGADRINGVTHDGRRVWAATGSKLVAFDPQSGAVARTAPVASATGAPSRVTSAVQTPLYAFARLMYASTIARHDVSPLVIAA